MELTPAIRTYVEEKLEYIAKLVSREESASITVEVGKENKHHNKGSDIMRAEFNLTLPGTTLRVVELEPDLYKAVDKAKDDLARQIIDRKEKFEAKRRQPRPDKM